MHILGIIGGVFALIVIGIAVVWVALNVLFGGDRWR